MNDMQGFAAAQEPESSIRFTGSWQEFLPIALTNLLLTIVTLGIYRFWAKARERRYLWSRTHVVDDSLEWTGTGKEMFLGFLVVFVVLIPVLLVGQMVLEGLVLRGQALAAGLLTLAFYGGVFYLVGVGSFRALRYRLSRTYWHGIRGGSEDGGWSYGLQFLWKSAVGIVLLGFLVPWAQTSLWNDRWNRMSFGQHQFEAGAGTDGLFGRWMLVYLAPVIGFVAGLVTMGAAFAGGVDGRAAGVGSVVLVLVLGYGAFLLFSLAYYAAFYRQVTSATSIAGLQFEFTAQTSDWLKLILGNIALVIFTLGAGLMFVGYRNWSFAVRHIEAYGVVDLDTLLQSRAAATGDAEGLADAFDIGAI